jgi:hypothetical protein
VVGGLGMTCGGLSTSDLEVGRRQNKSNTPPPCLENQLAPAARSNTCQALGKHVGGGWVKGGGGSGGGVDPGRYERCCRPPPQPHEGEDGWWGGE